MKEHHRITIVYAVDWTQYRGDYAADYPFIPEFGYIIGFLLKEDEAFLTLAQVKFAFSDNVRNVIVVPKSAVISRKDFEIEEEDG